MNISIATGDLRISLGSLNSRTVYFYFLQKIHHGHILPSLPEGIHEHDWYEKYQENVAEFYDCDNDASDIGHGLYFTAKSDK